MCLYIFENIFSILIPFRLYTGDETTAIDPVVRGPSWRKVRESNLDPDISFSSDIHFLIEKTLTEHHAALFWVSYFVNNMKEYECQVILNIMTSKFHELGCG